MKILTLKRVTENQHGTRGVLIEENGNPVCVTMERQWKDNRAEESCVPPGEWIFKRTVSPHFGMTFQGSNITGRDNILFHKGNYQTDSKGCIILGDSFGEIGEIGAVLGSGIAFSRFTKLLEGSDEFKLVVVKV